MVAAQPGQHRLIPVGVEDAVQDDVVAVIKPVADHVIDQPDVNRAGTVPFLEDDPARDEILGDPGHLRPAGRSQRLGRRTLARSGVTAQGHQPRLSRPHRHTRDPKRAADGYIGYTVGLVA